MSEFNIFLSRKDLHRNIHKYISQSKQILKTTKIQQQYLTILYDNFPNISHAYCKLQDQMNYNHTNSTVSKIQTENKLPHQNKKALTLS